MYCSNCGAELPDGARFCGSCGTKVAIGASADAASVSRGGVVNGDTSSSSRVAKKQTHRVVGWAALGFVALAAIIALLFVSRFTHSSEGTHSPEGIAIDETTFPDEVLRSQIASVADLDGDGLLSNEEIAALKTLHVTGPRSVSGLEALPALEELTAEGDQLEEVVLAQMPVLETVVIHDAPNLKLVEVTGCPSLKVADFSDSVLPVISFDEDSEPELVTASAKAIVNGVDESIIQRVDTADNGVDDSVSPVSSTDAKTETKPSDEAVVHFTGADFVLPEAWQGKVEPEIGQISGTNEWILWEGNILLGWDSAGAEKVDKIRKDRENGIIVDYADISTETLPDGTTLIFGRGNDGVCSVEIEDPSGAKGYLWTFANTEFRAAMGSSPEVVESLLQLQADAAGVSSDGDPYEIADAFLKACAEQLTLLGNSESDGQENAANFIRVWYDDWSFDGSMERSAVSMYDRCLPLIDESAPFYPGTSEGRSQFTGLYPGMMGKDFASCVLGTSTEAISADVTRVSVTYVGTQSLIQTQQQFDDMCASKSRVDIWDVTLNDKGLVVGLEAVELGI